MPLGYKIVINSQFIAIFGLIQKLKIGKQINWPSSLRGFSEILLKVTKGK
jgi:glutaredoxin 2